MVDKRRSALARSCASCSLLVYFDEHLRAASVPSKPCSERKESTRDENKRDVYMESTSDVHTESARDVYRESTRCVYRGSTRGDNKRDVYRESAKGEHTEQVTCQARSYKKWNGAT